MAARYTVETAGDIALVAATDKTIMMIVNPAGGLFRIVELSVSFDGVTAGNEPVEVSLVKYDATTTGTRTAHTPLQTGGPTKTGQVTAFRNYTVEPTALQVVKEWLVRPDGGLLLVQFPLGREPEQIESLEGYGLTLNAADGVNVQGYMEFEEG